MLSCFEEHFEDEGNEENRGEGMAPISHGASWPNLVLGSLWAQWSCCGAWVTKSNENWGGTGPLAVQNTGLPLTSRRVGRQPLWAWTGMSS